MMPSKGFPAGANAIDAHVASKIRDRRRELGLTLVDVAEALGISYQQLQKYENGSNRISAGRLKELADLCAVPVSYFFEGLERGDAIHAPCFDNVTLRLARRIHRLSPKLRRSLLRILESLDEAGGPDSEQKDRV